jgi:hypothetical protein
LAKYSAFWLKPWEINGFHTPLKIAISDLILQRDQWKEAWWFTYRSIGYLSLPSSTGGAAA